MRPPPPPSSTARSATSAVPTSLTITLKSLRPSPPLSLSLRSQSADTTIHTLKTLIRNYLNRPTTDGIKVLYRKRPCSDAKTVLDVLSSDAGKEAEIGGETEVEFGVMIVGGGVGSAVTGEGAESGKATVEGEDTEMKDASEAAGIPPTPAAQGRSGEEVLQEEEFWRDLQAFLVQRLRDEKMAGDVWELFKGAWNNR
ncbi:MAG: hypothetical protein Q9190_007236 [Brigantiaea leucoxantha]